MRIPIQVLLVMVLALSMVRAAEGRLLYQAKVNGKDVALALDTGSPYSILLLEATTEKLGLAVLTKGDQKFTPILLSGNLLGKQVDVSVEANVFNLGFGADVDGLIGWPALDGKIWKINWSQLSLEELPTVPNEASSWQSFKLDRQIPVAAVSFNEGKDFVYFDTGADSGVHLPDTAWEKWKQRKPQGPVTMGSGRIIGGYYMSELYWVSKMDIGLLELSEITVEKNFFDFPQVQAVLGISAMKNFDIILDRKQDRIYLKKRAPSLYNFDYNRLGATFPPSDASDQLVGCVLENSPAYRAGLRTGDILLKVDDIDMTKWKTDAAIWKKNFWSAKAGTSYILKVDRNGKELTLPVALEEIFPLGN